MKTFNFLPLCLFAMAVLFFGSFASAQEEPSATKVAEWKKGAEKGDVVAQFHLGICYAKGWGVPVDKSQALSLARKGLRMSADKGDIEAQYWLGKACEYGLGDVVEKNEVEAISWYTKSAIQGYYPAEQALGDCYARGHGVEADLAQAIRWYSRSAEKGDVKAQKELAKRCQYDFRFSASASALWFRKAAEQGYAVAQERLGNCYSAGLGVIQDKAEAAKWYRRAAEQGDTKAQTCLGECYFQGLGVPQDYAEAIKWWRKVTEKVLDEVAATGLGKCYASGLGVQQDYSEAVKWFKKVAEQECFNAEAQACLGSLYYAGLGVSQDYSEAAKWFLKAAVQWNGSVIAQAGLGFCYYFGQGVQKDYSEAVKWFQKAAEQGSAFAQYGLGLCYGSGEGVLKDDVESYKWTLLAAAQGIEMAKSNIPIAESRLLPSQRAEGQRLAKEWERARSTQGSISKTGASPAATPTREQPKVTGTGFLITHNGYLITNHHVVKDSGKVRVQTTAGLLDAVVVRTDAASDLALLKVTGTFDALPVVSSRNSRLGSTVATVGFPNIGLQGFEPKLSKGDISSLAGMQDDVKQFQISVPVQPGNSGGPLFDERGNVVGVVTAQLNQEAALASTGTLVQSVNYAVKSSYLLSFLEAVPEVSKGLLDAKTNEQKFEVVVDDVKKSTVLIVGY